jgi:hypothetical protein
MDIEEKELLNVSESKLKEMINNIKRIENAWPTTEKINELNNTIKENAAQFLVDPQKAIEINPDEMMQYFNLCFIYSALFYLSYLVSSCHAIYTRYPIDDKSPLRIYNEFHNLIVHYMELYDILDKCLNILGEDVFK